MSLFNLMSQILQLLSFSCCKTICVATMPATIPIEKPKLQSFVKGSKVRIRHAMLGVEGDVVVENIQNCDWAMGYNAMSDKYENLLESGVIDPSKVTSVPYKTLPLLLVWC